jgi:hypothetical protein
MESPKSFSQHTDYFLVTSISFMIIQEFRERRHNDFTQSLTFSSRLNMGWLIVLLCACCMFISQAHAATIRIVNLDDPGEGFNDLTAFAPVGGNTAITLGQARLKAFEHAANILAQMLISPVVIHVDARIDPLGPNILGSAGPNTVHRNFPRAQIADTWYVQALANALAGQDLDPATSDINATFSSTFSNWYFGLDGNPPAGHFDFATVVLHEIIHGLGFLPLVDVLTGEKFLGADDVFMRWLEHHGAVPADYPSMTDIQRQMASVAESQLHFVGANSQMAAGILTAGVTGTHLHMYAPNPVQPGSSISHFTNTIKPDQLMEPGIASGKAIHDLGLAQPILKDLGWTFAMEADFTTRHDVNDDGKADLVWRNMSSGEVAIWLMNGTAIGSFGFLGGVPLAWHIAGSGDIDGDGKADVIWQQTLTGTVAIWLMNGLNITSVAFPGSTSTAWQIQSVDDLNGDGKADLVWRHTGSGEAAAWLMNGPTIASVGFFGQVPMDWQVAGTGDVNGDGQGDVIWHHRTTGTVAVWLMDGLTILSAGFPGSTSTDWQIRGVGDVNGDGKADLVWRHTGSGGSAVWLMNGTALTAAGFLGGVPLAWEIADTGDSNGDGKMDIIWRNHETGTVAVWLMNGLSRLLVGFPGSTSIEWMIQN